ncbi:MAG: domain S-box protein [Chthoniobacteraceae bacterium]|nr:domain S-box protein [Chthoniobacteraceae bacterium]
MANPGNNVIWNLNLEMDRLRARLQEANATLSAIRDGAVDALVVKGEGGDQVYTLQGAEQPYRIMVETMNEGAVVITPDGLILFSNHRLGSLLKESLQSIVGANLLSYVKLEDRDRFAVLCAQGCRTPASGEIALFCRDGTAVPVDLALSPLKMQELQGICIVVVDLTERKKMEEALRQQHEGLKKAIEALEESRARLAGIVGSAMDAIITIDADLRIVLFNAAAEQMLGCEAAAVLGTSIARFLPEGFRAEECVHAGSPGTVKGVEEPLGARRMNGEVFPIEASISHVEIGARTLFTIIMRDITERKRANEQMEAALKKDMLLQKEVVLRREIHHRVKNNLQVICSLLYLQSADVTEPKTLEALREAQTRARSIALIHEKLYASSDMTRIESNGYIGQLAADVFQAYEVSHGRIVLKVNSEGIYFGLDEAMPCGLIVNELVSNALKHGFPGGREGIIAVELRLVGSDYIELCVRDDGVGLPEGFDVEKDVTFGLKLVRDLTRQLEGTIRFQRDHGTAVRITFPNPESAFSHRNTPSDPEVLPELARVMPRQQIL